MRLTEQCPTCARPAIVVSDFRLGETQILTLKCGHISTEKFSPASTNGFVKTVECIPVSGDSPTAISLDPKWLALDDSGHSAHNYQIDGVEFGEKANFRFLLGDDLGLGKTSQALLSLRHHPELFPVLILVKSATTFQWAREFQKWCISENDESRTMIPIMNRNQIIPGLDCYIMGHELLATGSKDKNGSAIERLYRCGIKTVVVDECHAFKDQNSQRTKALITLITRSEIHNRIFLSGTAIVNRAGEYFTVLNLLDPKRFNSYASFCRNWLLMNEKGVYDRILPWRINEFHELTAPYILRRTREEVQKDLPPFNLTTESYTIDDPEFRKLYNAQLDMFSNFMNNGNKLNATEILGWLARIRQITGMAKVQPVTNDIIEFIKANPGKKLIVGVHHIDVRNTIAAALQANGISVLQMGGEHNAIQKDQIIELHRSGDAIVLLINALSGGVGLNLQYCSDIWLMERMWSPAHEKQFWGRCHRQGQTVPVFARILEAYGTIDHWYARLLKEKMVILGETLDNFVLDSGNESLKEFAELVIQGRLN